MYFKLHLSIYIFLNLASYNKYYTYLYICMIMMQEHTIEHRKAEADVLPGEETTG